MEFPQILFLLFLSVVMVSSYRSGLEKLRKKLTAVETSLFYDIESIREELQSNSEQLATIITLLNSTDDDDNRITENTNDVILKQELQRVRRGFSEVKLGLIHEQAERNAEFEALSKRLGNTINELSSRIKNQTDGTIKQINEFVYEVETRLKILLDTTDKGVNNTLKTMADIVEKAVGEMNNGIQAHVYSPVAERDQLFDITSQVIRERLFKAQDGVNREKFVNEVVKTCGLIDMLEVFNITLSENYYQYHTIRFTCQYNLDYGKIRLANFSRVNSEFNGSSGRVEVYYEGDWGTVCDDRFDDKDATVICVMIGFRKGRAKTKAHFGRGFGLILLDELDCIGNETSIFDCKRLEGLGIGEHDCYHGEDAGVICSNE